MDLKKSQLHFRALFFSLKFLGSFSVVVFCDLVFFPMKSCLGWAICICYFYNNLSCIRAFLRAGSMPSLLLPASESLSQSQDLQWETCMRLCSAVIQGSPPHPQHLQCWNTAGRKTWKECPQLSSHG